MLQISIPNIFPSPRAHLVVVRCCTCISSLPYNLRSTITQRTIMNAQNQWHDTSAFLQFGFEKIDRGGA